MRGAPEATGVAITYITDPWGTYIELNEGLGRVAGIATAMSDVRPVLDSSDIEAETRAGRPVLLDGTHPVHLAQ